MTDENNLEDKSSLDIDMSKFNGGSATGFWEYEGLRYDYNRFEPEHIVHIDKSMDEVKAVVNEQQKDCHGYLRVYTGSRNIIVQVTNSLIEIPDKMEGGRLKPVVTNDINRVHNGKLGLIVDNFGIDGYY